MTIVWVVDDGEECTCDEPSGAHRFDCVAFEVECTCYEMNGGHEPMCPYGRSLRDGAITVVPRDLPPR